MLPFDLPNNQKIEIEPLSGEIGSEYASTTLDINAILGNNDRCCLANLLANCKNETEKEKAIAWNNQVYEHSYKLTILKATFKKCWWKIHPKN